MVDPKLNNLIVVSIESMKYSIDKFLTRSKTIPNSILEIETF